jgi:hypothetical protein
MGKNERGLSLDDRRRLVGELNESASASWFRPETCH